jgi:hypothetical protein
MRLTDVKYIFYFIAIIVALKILQIIMVFSEFSRHECTNTNRILDISAPGQKAYDAELVRQLNKAGKKKTKFWINKYMERDNRQYMSVYIQGPGVCAEALLEITGNEYLDNYLRVKGVSYHGAGLQNLEYSIDSSNGSYIFKFISTTWIVD